MLIKFFSPVYLHNFASMNIESYISQLLYRHQCVTVPGFGAFLTELQSSKWNENNNTFSPPKKIVFFNSFLQNNDGLLANFISVKEKITYEEGVICIQQSVNNWKNQLRENKSLVLSEIGVISVNNEGNLIFEPQTQINYNTYSFGLNTIVSQSITRQIVEIEEPLLENETIQITPQPLQSRSNGYLKYAAIFVTALSAAGAFGYKSYTDNIKNETILVQQEVQEEVENRIQEATFFIQSPLPNVTLTIKEEKLNYHIVAGAFRDEKNAENIFQKLSKEGYKSRRLKQNKHGLYPVLYGSYVTYEESQKALKDIKKKEDSDAWVLIQEL